MLEDIFEKGKDVVKNHKVIVAVLESIMILLVIFLVWLQGAGTSLDKQNDLTSIEDFSSISNTKDSSENSDKSDEKKNTTNVMVDIKGAVNKEGVYSLPENSRVTDLVKLAGGMTEEADKNSVNLAQKLTDEEVIYIVKIGEDISVINVNSNKETNDGSRSNTDTSGKINLNSATLEDLKTISGIGEKRAQDILAYRDSNNGFTTVDELSNISGIGSKTLEKLKTEVTVD